MSEDRPDTHSERQYEPSLDEAVRSANVALPDHLEHLSPRELEVYYLAKLARSRQRRDDQLGQLKLFALYFLAGCGARALVEKLRDSRGIRL